MKRIHATVGLAIAAFALVVYAASSPVSAARAAEASREPAPQVATAVSITSNPSNVAVEFELMAADAVRVFRQDKTYVWEKDSMVEEDFSKLKGAVALVCTRTIPKPDGLSVVVGNANISGLRKPDKAFSQWIRKGRLYPVGVASFGFDKFWVMRDVKEGRPMAYLSEGGGKVVLVWFIPDGPADYAVNELAIDKSAVVGIKVQ
jgi:hypothetical protein